ncbi:unnamed protein product [Didymodactylos carnosus]|uniref:T-cell immunomodulatory protein TIP C2 domain-containing protein n=1 Tax=Didymodactylos carnosus TaxID=1234261 RepID=A0A813WTH8_9BILA|nr:unnamed protein product [Didymodactylos carnosus]CAF3644716.1 unnamed protein product [Didymodactylos carnosus]
MERRINCIVEIAKTNEEKRVFDLNFIDNKRFSIDDCIPLAFGDFNADKVVDIFCRNTEGNQIQVYLNDDKSPVSKEIFKTTIPGIVYDALASDLDGDSQLDLFILYKSDVNQQYFSGGVLWGNRKILSELQTISITFQNHPTVFDANGDSYVDLLGMMSTQNSDFKLTSLSLRNRSVSPQQLQNIQENLFKDSTQAIVDMNHDLSADLFLTVDNRSRPLFRVFRLPITDLSLMMEYEAPDAAIYHLSTFSDIDGDGELEHLLPLCIDKDCRQSKIYVRDNMQWYPLPINFNNFTRFLLKSELPPPFDTTAISIKTSDYNLDGYPDIVVVMKQGQTMNVPIILENKPCTDKTLCTYNRTFVPQVDETMVSAATNTVLAVFFDILENGYPDLLVLQTQQKSFNLIGFHNSLQQDVYFLKPYGNNQPGPSIKMETTTISTGFADNWQRLAAVQMAQAGQFSLELPYVIFGLGSTPNFVEKLTVGLPPNEQQRKLVRTWTQMIPNSQVVVIPSPLLNPEKWHTKLFITPSRMILHTGIALGVTLIILAVVLACLQYREKIEDDRERKVQAQAFHYDAL